MQKSTTLKQHNYAKTLFYNSKNNKNEALLGSILVNFSMIFTIF